MLERFQRSAISFHPQQSIKSALIRVLFVGPQRRPPRPVIPQEILKTPLQNLAARLARVASSGVLVRRCACSLATPHSRTCKRRDVLRIRPLTFATFASANFFRETQNSARQKATVTSSSLDKRRVKKTEPSGPKKDFCGSLMGPPRGARKSKKGRGG